MENQSLFERYVDLSELFCTAYPAKESTVTGDLLVTGPVYVM